LALKIAEIQLLEANNQNIPVILLDDVSSELDAERNTRLFDFLNSFDGQVFITTTDPAYLRIEGERQHFTIQHGVLTEEEI
jgi:DNA replication and repair protein RecF